MGRTRGPTLGLGGVLPTLDTGFKPGEQALQLMNTLPLTQAPTNLSLSLPYTLTVVMSAKMLFEREFWQKKAPVPATASDLCALF